MPDCETWKFINTFAPWLSALGTIAAVATSLYLSRRDRRIDLEVRAGLCTWLIQGGGPSHGDRFAFVNVTNHGPRPAKITGLGFRFGVVRRQEFLPPSPQGSAIPAKLEYSDEARYLYPLEDFCAGLFEAIPPKSFRPFPSLRLRSARAIVATSVGKAFYAPFTRDLRRELARRVHTISSGS